MLAAAFLIALGASLLVYLSLSGQRWLPGPLPRAAGWAGIAALLVAAWAGAQALSPLSAVLFMIVVAMLALAAFPYLSLLRRGDRP